MQVISPCVYKIMYIYAVFKAFYSKTFSCLQKLTNGYFRGFCFMLYPIIYHN